MYCLVNILKRKRYYSEISLETQKTNANFISLGTSIPCNDNVRISLVKPCGNRVNHNKRNSNITTYCLVLFNFTIQRVELTILPGSWHIIIIFFLYSFLSPYPLRCSGSHAGSHSNVFREYLYVRCILCKYSYKMCTVLG